MQHTIKLDAVTCDKINAMKEAKASYSEAAEKVKSINDSLLLPSGRARKGGRADLEAGSIESKVKYELYSKSREITREAVRGYITDIRNKHIVKTLTDFLGIADIRDPYEFDIIHASIESFNASGQAVIVNIEHNDFEVRCNYESYNGFRISITIKGEYCGIGGGNVEVRKIYEASDFIDKKEDGLKGELIDGYLVIDIPDTYYDNCHGISINYLKDVSHGLARSVGDVVVACSMIQEKINKTMRCNGINSLSSSIFYSI